MHSGDCLLPSLGKSMKIDGPAESRAASLRVDGKDDTTGRANRLLWSFSARRLKRAPLKPVLLEHRELEVQASYDSENQHTAGSARKSPSRTGGVHGLQVLTTFALLAIHAMPTSSGISIAFPSQTYSCHNATDFGLVPLCFMSFGRA